MIAIVDHPKKIIIVNVIMMMSILVVMMNIFGCDDIGVMFYIF
jgi:hypothetical protein